MMISRTDTGTCFSRIKSPGPLLVASAIVLMCLSNCTADDLNLTQINFENNFTSDRINITVDTLHVIQEGEDFLFGSLLAVISDPKGNLYLFDDQQATIFIFNEEGKYIKSLLQPGSGPGEVYNFAAQEYNPDNDELAIADGQNTKVMSIDSDEGGLINSWSYSASEVETPRNILHYKDRQYVFMYSLSKGQRYRDELGIDDYFHVYDLENQERLMSFGSREDILDLLGYKESISERFTSVLVGNALLLDDESIVYAPYVYSNSLLIFSRKESGWAYNKRVINNLELRPSFIDLEDETMIEPGYNEYSSYGQSGVYFGHVLRRSLGIYEIEDDIIINLFAEEFKVEEDFFHVVYGEVYNKNLEYIGGCKIMTGKRNEIIFDMDLNRQGNVMSFLIKGDQDKIINLKISSINIEGKQVLE